MRTNFVRTLALVGAVGLVACGDDGPTATGDPLTDEEAQDLSAIVLQTALASTAGGIPTGPAAADGPQAAPFTYSASIETSVPCSGGGSVAINGSATINGDDETGEYAVTYNVTEAHQNCVESGPNQHNFTLNSSLALGFVMEALYDGEISTLDWDGTLSGTIDWSSEGRSGSCSVSLTYAASFTGSTITVSTTGNVCGTTVSEEFTYGYET